MSAPESTPKPPSPWDLLNDTNERLYVIGNLADIISEAHCRVNEPTNLDNRQVCSLAILIDELVKQAQGMVESAQDQVRADKTKEAPAAPLAPGKITDTETFKKLENAMENPKPMSPKLNEYNPEYANAKVSVIALWRALDRLSDVADDPGRVGQWITDIHDEIQQCQVA